MLLAIAIKCKTALVDPPSAIMTLIEFSNALRVIMSDGFMSFSKRLSIAFPILLQSIFFSFEIASWELLPGKLIPRASIADAIVLAVYIPPQEPGPGRAVFSIAINSFSEILLLL